MSKVCDDVRTDVIWQFAEVPQGDAGPGVWGSFTPQLGHSEAPLSQGGTLGGFVTCFLHSGVVALGS